MNLTPLLGCNTINPSRPHGGLWINSRRLYQGCSSAPRQPMEAFFLRLKSGLSMAFCAGRPNGLPGLSSSFGGLIFGLLTLRRIATLINSRKAVLLSTKGNTAVNNNIFELRKDVTKSDLEIYLSESIAQALAQANVISDCAQSIQCGKDDAVNCNYEKDQVTALNGANIELLERMQVVAERLGELS